MFNKYWREYPWFFQLTQFALLVFVCLTFFGLLINYLGPATTGVKIADIATMSVSSAPKIRIMAFVYNAATTLSAFIIPCLLFAYVVHPRPMQYLGLKKPTNNTHWFIVLLLSLATIPTVSGIAGLVDSLPLPEGLQAAKEAFDMKQKAMMNLQTPAELLAALSLGAFIAPIGEELLFRGMMMKFAAKTIKGGIFLPIFLSAIFFGLIHGNVVGLLSLVISGVVLGYIYYLTSSLWLSIFSHAVVNMTQLFIVYFGRNNAELTRMMDSNDTPWALFLSGIIVFIASFYWLWKTRTPLPANWTEDFTPGEKEQGMGEKNLF